MTFALTLTFVLMVFWRPQEWLFPFLYGLPILDGVVALAVLGLLIEDSAGTARVPRDTPQIWLLAGLFFAAVMSHVAHTYFAGMVATMTEVFKITFFSFLLFCVLDRPRRLRTVAAVFVGMACLMAIHAILQQKRGYGFMGQLPVIQGRPGREELVVRSLFFGIFEDPNDLAQILAASIPFAFALPKRVSPIGLAFSGGVTWLLVAGILATNSRGGMIALIVAAALVAALILPARWLPRVMLVALVAGLVLCPLSEAFLDQSAHDRVMFWGEANWVFKENPVFGVGYGMLPDYIPESRASHNAFVLCYTELGVFGYWFWFGLLFLGFLGAWRAREALRDVQDADGVWLRRFAGLAIAALGSFCISSYFLTRAFVHPMFFLFAIAGALPVVARRYLPDEHPPMVEPRRDLFLWGTAGTLGSIMYIYFSILLLNKAFPG